MILGVILPAILSVKVYAGSFAAVDFNYLQGDFGSPITEKLSMFNVSLGRIETQYDISVSMPYLFLNRSDATESISQDGAGDLFLRGGYELVNEAKSGFLLYSSLGIKIAFADETQGLGSGESDVGLYVNLSKQWDQVRGTLYSGYIDNGDPAGIDYANTPLIGISIARYFGKTSGYLSLQKSAALVDTNDDPVSFSGGIYHMLNSQYTFRGQISVGLSDGSADYGFNIGLVNWF